MLLSVIEKRHSVRQYIDRPVEREKIELCLEAARLAPSAINSQPWRFIVIDEQPLLRRVAEQLCDELLKVNRFALEAPVIVAVIAEQPSVAVRVGNFLKNKPFNLIDIGIAAEHFCLQAVEEGLGTCMIGWFNEKSLRRILGVPRGRRIPLVITVGYPSKSYMQTRVRKSLDEIRSYNKYC